MTNFFDVIIKKDETMYLKIYGKVFEFKLLYKILAKLLSRNFKENIFFRLNMNEYPLLKKFYNQSNLDINEDDLEGYDEESKKIFKTIIYKIKSLYSYKKFFPYIQFYSKEECKKLEEIDRNFYQKIEQKEDYYQYNHYKLPIKAFEPNVFLYHHGLELLTNKSLEKIKNSDIIDAGGFIGDSALIFSEVTNKKVYTFDCCSKQIDLMKKTIVLNQRQNIIPVQMGLGKIENEIEINLYNWISANSALELVDNREPIGKELVKITTIDKFVNDNNLNVGLIKSDVEGMEQDLLNGGMETIKKFKPILLISVYHQAGDFYNIKKLIKSLNLGYTFKLYKPFDGSILFDTICVAEIGR